MFFNKRNLILTMFSLRRLVPSAITGASDAIMKYKIDCVAGMICYIAFHSIYASSADQEGRTRALRVYDRIVGLRAITAAIWRFSSAR